MPETMSTRWSKKIPSTLYEKEIIQIWECNSEMRLALFWDIWGLWRISMILVILENKVAFTQTKGISYAKTLMWKRMDVVQKTTNTSILLQFWREW